MANLPVDLINRLSSLSTKLSSAENDPSLRNEALQLSRRLTASLEDPVNVAVDLAFSPFLPIAARVADGLGLFRHIAESSGPITSTELASISGGEELLIVRILRPLAAIGFVNEVGEQKWEATPVTKAMATEEIAAGHRMVYVSSKMRLLRSQAVGEMIVGAAHKAPNYLREAGYHCPTDPRDGFMQYAFQTKKTTFELFSSIPRVFRDFNTFMGNTMGARAYWVDWYPIQERLLDGAGHEAEDALVVDVGGGKGHDLIALHERCPDQGRLILQDLAPVTDSLTGLNPSIEVMAYDFFTEQPVKGARSYFYHHILHDWSDSYCLNILRQVKAAMRPGYSRLLIHELILPEQNADKFSAVFDLVMMSFNAGMERTEAQWGELLSKAGLKVVKAWPAPEVGADGIIEAILEEE